MITTTTTTWLASGDMDLRPGSDGPGIMAFLIVAALVVVCLLLYRSLRKQLGRIDVDRAQRERDAGPDGRPGSAAP